MKEYISFFSKLIDLYVIMKDKRKVKKEEKRNKKFFKRVCKITENRKKEKQLAKFEKRWEQKDKELSKIISIEK